MDGSWVIKIKTSFIPPTIFPRTGPSLSTSKWNLITKVSSWDIWKHSCQQRNVDGESRDWFEILYHMLPSFFGGETSEEDSVHSPQVVRKGIQSSYRTSSRQCVKFQKTSLKWRHKRLSEQASEFKGSREPPIKETRGAGRDSEEEEKVNVYT